MINQIKIAVRGAGTLPLDEFTEFQGELKSLSKLAYESLKNEIIENGFSFTIHIWINDGKNYILDGHQRLRTVKKMVKEGCECPPFTDQYCGGRQLSASQAQAFSCDFAIR